MSRYTYDIYVCMNVYEYICMYMYICVFIRVDVILMAMLVNIFFLNKYISFVSFLSLSRRGGRRSKEREGRESQRIINSHSFPTE